MVQTDPNAIVTNTPNNSHRQSGCFYNSFVKYIQPAKTSPASVPSGQHHGAPSPSPSPRNNFHNPNLHTFPNSFKRYAASDNNFRSTLHPSKSYSEFPVSSLDLSDRMPPPLDGRKSTPPNMQELLQSSWDADSSVDCSCAVNSSSSSSASSSGPSESQPPKKSYLDAALSSKKQEMVRKASLPNGFSRNGSSNSAAPPPPTSPSSSTASSKDPISDQSTATVVPRSGTPNPGVSEPQPKPPVRSITFGTFDHSMLLQLASVSFRHLDSSSRLSRTRTIGKQLSVSTSYTATTIASSASYPPLSVSVETVTPSPKDSVKVAEVLDPLSGHDLGRCQSCNNHLKHCCRATINDILSGSPSP